MVSFSFAQVNLQHTFNGDAKPIGENIVENINRYVFRDGNTIQVYNPDFSLEKSLTVSLPDGFTLYEVQITSQHLFNTDNKYEFLISAKNPNAYTNSSCYAVLINEDGTVIQDFGYSIGYWSAIYRIDGQLILWLSSYTFNGNDYTPIYNTRIYSCSGDYTGVASHEPSKALLPYPNPASSTINLPYEIPQGSVSEMKIFNINGQLVEIKNIGSHFNNLQLNVESYSPGLYFYEYNGTKGKFIVQ